MEGKMEDELIPVLFRAERAGKFKGDVTAVFPTLSAGGHYMTCYQHVGQHGACAKQWYWATRAARPEEYRDLQRELESQPYEYKLKVVRRITYAMDKARQQSAA